tara:strand:- start:17 stop:193 length:177 start_codon:yes stop_codon:yes gene_type:complete
LHPEIAHYFKKEQKKAYIRLMWQNFVYLKIVEDTNVQKNSFKFTKMNNDQDITSEIVT